MLKADHDHPGGDARDEREAADGPDEAAALDTADDEGERADAGTSVDERSRPPQLWLVAAGVGLLAASALWLLGYADAAFVVAALGVVAWFFNVRVRLRHRNRHGDTEAQR